MDTDALTRSVCHLISVRNPEESLSTPQYRKATQRVFIQFLVFNILWFMAVDMCTVKCTYR